MKKPILRCAHGEKADQCIKNSKCKLYTPEQLRAGKHLQVK